MLPGMSGLAGMAIGELDRQVITVGQTGLPGARTRGLAPSVGSIVDGTSNIYAGAAITRISYNEDTLDLILTITGTLANSGWTAMAIGATNFNRTAAAFSAAASTSWTWASTASDPFGANGSSSTVVFS